MASTFLNHPHQFSQRLFLFFQYAGRRIRLPERCEIVLEQAADPPQFSNGFQEGYPPKELSLLLKNEGIIIPAYLIQKFLSETADAPPAQKREKTPAQTPAPARTSIHLDI